jgi:hypothetical protein
MVVSAADLHVLTRQIANPQQQAFHGNRSAAALNPDCAHQRISVVSFGSAQLAAGCESIGNFNCCAFTLIM